MALDAQILLSILAHEATDGDISRTLRVTPATYALAITNGTGANQAQVVWSDSRTIGASEALNLAALADTRDGASVAVAFSAVKLIYVRNTHAENTLRIGGATFGSFGGLPAASPRDLPPGGCYMMTSPSDSGFGSGTLAAFAPASGEVTYDILLIGEGTIT